jgi:histidinol-phosphatase
MTSENSVDADLALANELADEASVVSLSFFRREFSRWSKSDGSPVTQADVAVEKDLRGRLARERPDDAVLGEEEGQTGASARRWIVDAIDGTVDFAAGGADWGTLIALESNGRIVLGVCDQPVHKRRYWAVRGKGAFRTDSSGIPKLLRVSGGSGSLSSARSYVPPAEWWPPDDRAHRVAKALAAATVPSPLTDHPALQVAAGGYELAVFLIGGPWDVAAPSVIVEEAGGRFTDLSGRPDVFSGTAIFSNGTVHDNVLRLTGLV